MQHLMEKDILYIEDLGFTQPPRAADNLMNSLRPQCFVSNNDIIHPAMTTIENLHCASAWNCCHFRGKFSIRSLAEFSFLKVSYPRTNTE